MSARRYVRRSDDLPWEVFRDSVLSRRKEFKGVFIQEVTVAWNLPLYQRPQHISVALGRLGYLVLYRTNNLGDDDVDGFREVSKNVWLSNRGEVDRIEGVVRSIYSTYPHSTKSLMRNGRRGVLLYEYVDHIDPQIFGDPGVVRELVKLKSFAFSGGVDFIAASARKLKEEALEHFPSDRVVLIPNGVDTRHYRDPVHTRSLLPANLVQFRRRFSRVLGYFGALAPWLWYQVLSELVPLRRDVGFVLIGPDYYGGSLNLPRTGNLLYLGPIDYQILPAFAREFDVCFIPFAPGEVARTTSPLKLFEYFALEKPVVVTSDMLECVAFPEVFHGESTSALSLAIDRALAVKDDPSFKARLAELADQNDWEQRARAMEIMFRTPEVRE